MCCELPWPAEAMRCSQDALEERGAQAALLRLAQQPHAAGAAEMLTVNARAGPLRQQDVAGHDHLLARRGPAPQAEHRAVMPLVRHAIDHQRIVLAVIHHEQVKHRRILERPPHEIVVLDAMPVVGDGDDPGLGQRTDRREFLAGDAAVKPGAAAT